MRAKSYIYVLISFFFVGACVSPPDNFPTVPEINFSNISYVEMDNGVDSLIIALRFKDAEGDLGLDSRDINPPFHPFEFLRDNQGNLITYSNRPTDAPEYNPIDWAVRPTVDNIEIKDTLWVKQNPNYNNIFMQFFIKRNGNYEEFKWSDPPYYTTVDGRFPEILSSDNPRAIEGTIQYAIQSSGWRPIFRNDTIRVNVQIQDRALNKSNIISTPDFTLNQIMK
ncbi:hypothetical protein KZP23_00925 [Echinicola marina]|uniref:hypothetical protein n=1 Tax=Echinicola marina TaxID=2859768 RepID=UPI001CF68092|nr:hypothetical protein [Echinicola marina]UCS93635.1 hypothetical protein KZP23_00925 [Echinicola marina]